MDYASIFRTAICWARHLLNGPSVRFGPRIRAWSGTEMRSAVVASHLFDAELSRFVNEVRNYLLTSLQHA